MDFLTEVDKLVQLIECPIFTCESPASRMQQEWGRLCRGAGLTPGMIPRMSRM